MGMLLLSVSLGAFLAGLLAAWLVKLFLFTPIAVLGQEIVLRHAENPGIAFGLRIPSPWQEILILLALLLVFRIAIRSTTVLSRIAYGLIIGGALANIADRIVDGFVTDYIAVGSFPIFNIPDSCITIGVFLLLVESTGIVSYIRRKS